MLYGSFYSLAFIGGVQLREEAGFPYFPAMANPYYFLWNCPAFISGNMANLSFALEAKPP
jgi:hypothetical protein